MKYDLPYAFLKKSADLGVREELEHMEKQLYKILKTGMTVFLLILAYFLPGICAEKMGQLKTGDAGQRVVEDAGKGAQTQAAMGAGAGTQIQEQAGDEETQAALLAGAEETTAVLQAETEETQAAAQGQEGNRGTIVLDPGHGGEDPGMVGIGDVEEKGINLQISLTLKALLEEQGFSVVLTRTDDNGLYDAGTSNKKAQDMQRRCAIIEEENPVLTVSIHQNSYTDPAVYGPQVFYYEHSEEGKALASCIQEALNTGLEIGRPRAIKSNTNYYILKRSASVTVLVECAFLSNPDEAEKIQTQEYQEAVARAICGGILEYLQ